MVRLVEWGKALKSIRNMILENENRVNGKKQVTKLSGWDWDEVQVFEVCSTEEYWFRERNKTQN